MTDNTRYGHVFGQMDSIQTMSHTCRWRCRLPERFGALCRVVARAAGDDALAAAVSAFQFRDLRAMAGTEAKRQGIDPTALLGHADAKMTRRYLRDREIPVVSANRFGQVKIKQS